MEDFFWTGPGFPNSRQPSVLIPAPARTGRNPVANVLLLLVLACTGHVSTAAEPIDPGAEQHFQTKVKPLLVGRCVSCHGPDKQLGGLRLDSFEAALKGGDTGPALVPGDPSKSLMLEAVQFVNSDLQMPPKAKLSDREIAIVERWIEQGAIWPEATPLTPQDGIPTVLATGNAFEDEENPIRKLFHGERLDLWSLQMPKLPELEMLTEGDGDPSAAERLSFRTIDRLIDRKIAEAGIIPVAEADRRTLLRRLSFDLIGLPPTPQELQEFLEDTSPHAYENVVDRLLGSPRYGERWARHWLDVVRYADTEGFERDEFRPVIWQYRDYVVRSFNQDKPYNQFVREQLAGDELLSGEPQSLADADMLIATGFLRLGQWDSTAAIFQEEARLHDQQMADLTNTTGSAFLGLTLSCCQCHDHKVDPLSHSDHFRIRAFFAGVQPKSDLVIELAEEQGAIARHNSEIEDQLVSLKEQQAQLDKDASETREQSQELSSRIEDLEQQKRSLKVAMGASDAGVELPATHLFAQGDFSQPREEVLPGFVSVLDPGPATIESPQAGKSGRRLALANWIVARENPWTSRVIVNRVWQHHFGIGLVSTPNDFGYSGARPTHRELLDWLAVAFMNDGWSLKRLHRAIVCSATYRRQSGIRDSEDVAALIVQNELIDPENRLLWRQNVVRLDAETLRDSLLAVSGSLRDDDSGKPLWPHIPEELLTAQPGILEAKEGADGGRLQGWYEDPIEETDVRSLFLIRKRTMPIPFLQVFDLPETTVSCARRDATVVAPQSLTLLNSPESIRFANLLAERVRNEAGDSRTQQIETLFRVCLARVPDATEKELCLELLKRHAEQYQHTGAGEQADAMALRDLCRAILNLNEFLYID
ncbi:DUF1553 domain-containing protein [Schlesneria sp.]|uniref:DUF1553 domain-containing protein n=1 Tax=Schlesneria sp. TaxID=2762018 RepID=UPI002F17D18F